MDEKKQNFFLYPNLSIHTICPDGFRSEIVSFLVSVEPEHWDSNHIE